MATETERKFLLKDDSWRANSDGGRRIMQGYLANSPHCTVRVRVRDSEAWLTVKGGASTDDGLSRIEYEYAVPLTDAMHMLESLAERPFIDKIRHELVVGAHTWEIDEFQAENAGLTVAEIELGRAAEPFERPAWLGEEVSDDPRYLNAALVRTPFSSW